MSMTIEDMKESVIRTLRKKGVYGAVEENLKSVFLSESLHQRWYHEEKETVKTLIEASKQTLKENSHLADGDNCTLIALKNAVESLDVIWED